VPTISDVYLISLIQLDRTKTIPLYRQIYDALRQAILDQQLAPGAKLPSSRDLADLLGVSRNTVVNALDQLVAEGYLYARVGAGIFVTSELPEELLYVSASNPAASPTHPVGQILSAQGRRFINHPEKEWLIPNQTRHNLFRAGISDISVFPFKIWHKLTTKYLLDQPAAVFDFNDDPAGYYPLRVAIAQYLSVARAVNGTAKQVIMLNGTEQAAYLAGRLLLNPGDKVWMENPGFPGAARAFQAAGAEVVPIPVDDDGMDVNMALQTAPDAKIAYVTPSHQSPLGYTLSLERRMQLLNWAARSGAWVMEDDYDSEYRYEGRPLAALQGLDVNGRVIYLGSLSKVLFPGVRLDYMIVPPDLVDIFIAGRTTVDIHIATLSQAVLADFMAAGHFTRHIRRMRRHYKKRRDALVQAVQASQSNLLQLGPIDCGMHICGWLPPGIDDEAIFEQASAAGIEAMPISRFCLGESDKKGIILGYAAATPQDIGDGVQQLLELIAANQQ